MRSYAHGARGWHPCQAQRRRTPLAARPSRASPALRHVDRRAAPAAACLLAKPSGQSLIGACVLAMMRCCARGRPAMQAAGTPALRNAGRRPLVSRPRRSLAPPRQQSLLLFKSPLPLCRHLRCAHSHPWMRRPARGSRRSGTGELGAGGDTRGVTTPATAWLLHDLASRVRGAAARARARACELRMRRAWRAALRQPPPGSPACRTPSASPAPQHARARRLSRAAAALPMTKPDT